MSILRVDGFDAYQTLGSSLVGQTLPGTGYSLFTNGGSSTIRVAPGVGAGSLALQVERSNSFNANFTYTFSTEADKLVVGFAFWGTTRSRILSINGGALTIDWDATGPLSINGELGPNVIVLSRWYYLELVVDRATGNTTLWVNDVEYLTVSTPVGVMTNDNWALTIGWANPGNPGTLRIDDLIVIDSTPGDVTDRLGPVEHITRLPATEAVMQFDNPTTLTPVEVAASVPPSESVFLESSRSGDLATFLNASYTDERDILAVTVSGAVSKTDLDDRQVGLLVDDGTGSQEVVFDVGLTFAYQQATFVADSTGAPWTPALVNTASWGAAVRP